MSKANLSELELAAYRAAVREFMGMLGWSISRIKESLRAIENASKRKMESTKEQIILKG